MSFFPMLCSSFRKGGNDSMLEKSLWILDLEEERAERIISKGHAFKSPECSCWNQPNLTAKLNMLIALGTALRRRRDQAALFLSCQNSDASYIIIKGITHISPLYSLYREHLPSNAAHFHCINFSSGSDPKAWATFIYYNTLEDLNSLAVLSTSEQTAIPDNFDFW